MDELHRRRLALEKLQDELTERAQWKYPLTDNIRQMMIQTATILTCTVLICDYIEHCTPDHPAERV